MRHENWSHNAVFFQNSTKDRKTNFNTSATVKCRRDVKQFRFFELQYITIYHIL